MNYFNKAKELYLKHERIILPASFVVGFLWDNFTLRRIDLFYENLVFIWNIFLALAVIILLNVFEQGPLKGKVFGKIAVFLPILLQFSFGNLFSGFFIFYVRSGSVFVSWPFLFFLGVLFFGNDFLRKRYLGLAFQISVFFIALFSYSVFILPVILNRMGVGIFLLSGFLSLLAISLILLFLFRITPAKVKLNKKPLFLGIGGIYLVFQILYFANIIPPIPLSLKNSGIFHSIERAHEGNYIYKAAYEPAPGYLFFEDRSGILNIKKGAPIYYYSAIFSPIDLDIPIFHRWSRFDEQKSEWIEIARIPLQVIGGRAQGFRAYSYTQNTRPGKWRVDVMTQRGQVLGRKTFRTVEADVAPELKAVLL